MENVKLDLIPGRVMPICHASQYDVGRVIRFNLVENDVPYVLDGTETVTFGERKIDGNVVTAACTVTATKSYVDLETTEQMCACYGQNLCELKIEKGSDIIGTLNFVLDVERDPLEGGIQSESEIYNLQVQINEIIQQELENYDIYGAYVTEQTSGAIANFTDGADNVPVKDLSVEFAATQASGTPTPSSPIPITPVNSIKVTRTGKNLLSEVERNDLTNNIQFFFTSGLLLRAGTYTWSTSESINWYVVDYASNSNLFVKYNSTFITFTLDNDTVVKFYTYKVGINHNNVFQLELGSTATAYEAYNGVTKTLDLGGDYYGGEVDKDGNITSNRVCVTVIGADTENWSILNEGDTSQRFRLNPAFSGYTEVASSHFEKINSNTGDWGRYRLANGYLVLTDSNNQIGSVANLKNWLATQNANGKPVQFEFEIATPATAQASNAIELNTLLGVNNFFSDAGDVDVTYRADTALYIDKRLNA